MVMVTGVAVTGEPPTVIVMGRVPVTVAVTVTAAVTVMVTVAVVVMVTVAVVVAVTAIRMVAWTVTVEATVPVGAASVVLDR